MILALTWTSFHKDRRLWVKAQKEEAIVAFPKIIAKFFRKLFWDQEFRQENHFRFRLRSFRVKKGQEPRIKKHRPSIHKGKSSLRMKQWRLPFLVNNLTNVHKYRIWRTKRKTCLDWRFFDCYILGKPFYLSLSFSKSIFNKVF